MDDPIEILGSRLARGEISEEEYRRIRDRLDDARPTGIKEPAVPPPLPPQTPKAPIPVFRNMTACVDCGTEISTAAVTCPKCGRAGPGYRAPEPQVVIRQEQDSSDFADFIGIIWLMHAFFVAVKISFLAGVISLFIGPFIWIFR